MEMCGGLTSLKKSVTVGKARYIGAFAMFA